MHFDPVQAARDQITAERWQAAVAREKRKLLAARWWHRFVPFVITITRRAP